MDMERLWAPWRMEYIAAVNDEKNCFLCAAASCRGEEKEHLMLWRTDRCVVVMNRWPYNNGHLLIAPKKHVSDIGALKEADFTEFGTLLQHCRRELSRLITPDGFNVGLNLGRTAGAGVADHLHWHIVPRWNGDTNFMTSVGSVKVIPQSLGELYDCLKPAEPGR